MRFTERDKEILGYIKSYMIENGVTPTLKEIAGGVGLYSLNTVHYHIKRLEEHGYITRVGGDKYTVKGIKYVEAADG